MQKAAENKVTSCEFKDLKSFEHIYALYWKQVYAVCYNNLKNVEVAQGLVQDIFLSLWERRDTVHITSSIEHYLVRSAKMKVFEYIRNKTIRENHLSELRSTASFSTSCTEQEVVYNNLNEQVQVLLDQLPAQCQQVFSLREEGRSNKEIALCLQISEKAVEYHITKALRFLKSNIRFVFES